MKAASALHGDRPWLAAAIAALLPLLLALPGGARANAGEVDALLRRLAGSGCEFRRHGQWHDAGAASEHLRMKHRYILRVRPGLTTEEFITFGASGSSTTLQPYKVRCKDSVEQTGAEWMRGELEAVRASRLPTGAASAPLEGRAPRPSH
jgi:hypothetical protein